MDDMPDSVTAAKLIRDLMAAHEDAYSRGLNPIGLLDALHKRGWAIVRAPRFDEVVDAGFADVEAHSPLTEDDER